jgi:RNA-directed DNA polymerase
MNSMYQQIYSFDNLFLAYQKARKGKTKKQYVLEFEKDLERNLLDLQFELKSQNYKPLPMKTFILRDPKTRKISKAQFRDRVIHHAIVNILEPIFEKSFIYDSCANRKGKGTHFALKRFDKFKNQVSKNNTLPCFVLKADIKHYFQEINHDILIKIIRKKISDQRVIWLIKQIIHSGGRTPDWYASRQSNLPIFRKRLPKQTRQLHKTQIESQTLHQVR